MWLARLIFHVTYFRETIFMFYKVASYMATTKYTDYGIASASKQKFQTVSCCSYIASYSFIKGR